MTPTPNRTSRTTWRRTALAVGVVVGLAGLAPTAASAVHHADDPAGHHPVRRAHPHLVGRASPPLAVPGDRVATLVSVSGLPRAERRRTRLGLVVGLYGPFDHRPGAHECTGAHLVRELRLHVDRDDRVSTPSIPVSALGRYTWREHLDAGPWSTGATSTCGRASQTVLVRRLVPRLNQAVSVRKVDSGRRVHDTITVDGIADEPVTARWSLLGPVPARADGCAGVDWAAAPVIGHGTLAFGGDGVRHTPGRRLTGAGCFGYTVTVPGTRTTLPATAPAGLRSATVWMVAHQLHLHSHLSSARPVVGRRVRDSVRVGGLGRHDHVDLAWQLVGPVPTGRRGCRGLDWSHARTADHGHVRVAHPGRVSTPLTTVSRTGCWSYALSVPGTPTTQAVSEPAGSAATTMLAVRGRG